MKSTLILALALLSACAAPSPRAPLVTDEVTAPLAPMHVAAGWLRYDRPGAPL